METVRYRKVIITVVEFAQRQLVRIDETVRDPSSPN
jgi:hypothetical protein